MKKTLLLFAAITLFYGHSHAQSNVVATGGEATGNGGSVSFSVGQVAIQYNSDGTASVSEGVQQPYEISVIGVDEYPGITLNATVYPNPTANTVTLSIEEPVFKARQFQVFDSNGKLLISNKITSNEISIDFSTLAPGAYLLRVSDDQTVLKTFRVVKMQL